MAIQLTIQSITVVGSNILITAARSDSPALEVIPVNVDATPETVRIAIRTRVNNINQIATNVTNFQVLIGQIF